MTVIRTGSTKIRTGASRVLQRQPRQSVSTSIRREEPQAEIGFIAEAKKLEEAKSRKGRRGKEPLTINQIVQGVKDRNLQDAEAGYVLTQAGVSAELKAMLTPELLLWFDNRVQDYRKLMAECQAKYKVELEKVKEKHGKDPIRYTRERLKLKAKVYPSWSKQSQHATEEFKERQDKLAKAITGAKAKGVTGLSYDELYTMATTTKASAKKQAKEKGISDTQLAAIRGEKIEAVPVPEGITIKPEMKEQAVKVIGATVEEKKKAAEAEAEAKERGWSCFTVLQAFKVKLKDGSAIEVVALDSPSRSGAASARKKAEDAGYEVTWVTKKMSGETIKPTTKHTGAFNVTLEDGTKTTMVPFVDTETKDTLLIPKDFAAGLKETEAYKKATGTTEQKLGIAYTAQVKEFETWLDGVKKDYPELYKSYETQGYSALNKGLAEIKDKQELTSSTLDNKYKKDDGYDIVSALWDKSVTAKDLKLVGFEPSSVSDIEKIISSNRDLDAEFQKLPGTQQTAICVQVTNSKSYDKLSVEDKLAVLEHYGTVIKPGAWTAFKYSQQKGAVESKQMLIAITPVVGTVALWDKMNTWQRVVSIVGDVACVVPILAGAAAGARATKGYTAAARMKAALQGAGAMALAEVTAPAEIIFRPVETTKGIGRQVLSIAETLAHPKKLPLGATELAYTTARLPVDDIGSAKKAMQLRDAAVAAAIQGKPATATVGDISLTLTPSKLQEVGGAMAIHATPDIRPYLNGAVIKSGAEGSGMFIAPNFHSRFAQATAFGDIPLDGVRGGLIIRDQNVLKALAPSGKVYRSAAEIEAILKPGTVLPSPSQMLVTRDVAGHRLTLLVIGEPFTKSQVAKLKLLGSMDTVGQIFKPTMKLTGVQKSAVSSMDELISLSKERATIEQQLIAARAAGRTSEVQTLSQRVKGIDTQLKDLVTRVNVPREAIRPNELVWAQYADKGILERWRELNSEQARTTPRGTRLPDIRAGEAIRSARVAQEERRVPPGARRTQPITEARRAASYKPIYTRTYTPQRVPPYVPPYTPKRGVPHTVATVPYVPPRLSRVSAVKAPVTERYAKKRPIRLGRERVPRQRADRLVSWRQGAYYVTIVGPFRTTGTKPDVIFSRSKPPGAKVATGRRSPQKTLLSMGKVPSTIKLNMGAVTARVKHGRVLGFTRSATVRRSRRRR